jgi:serine/threonine-protein kinase
MGGLSNKYNERQPRAEVHSLFVADKHHMEGLPFASGDTIAGKYRLDFVIGRGGMGVVVSAHHLELDQRVAIKFLLQDLAERSDAAQRFRREARAAAKIRSDHVVRVIDVATLDDGIPYMVMEYLDGHDVAELLAKRDELPAELAVGYILEALEAISEAHAAGVVHRDLKPANLYLARRRDGAVRVKVLDFGISKSLLDDSSGDLRLTATATLMGSPLYMSPEQMQSARDVDTRADIWSIGAILYEMLAGRPPYVADTLPQLCNALLSSEPPRLRELNPEISIELEQVVLRCLERDRVRRWPSVAELATALTPFAAARMSVHAERARHMQSNTDISGLPDDMDRSRDAEPTVVQGKSDAVVDAPKTLQAWSASELSAHTGRRRTLVIGGVLLAAAAAALLLFGFPATEAGEPSASGAVELAPSPAAATETPPPAEDEGSVAPQPIQPYEPPEPSASASASAEPAAKKPRQRAAKKPSTATPSPMPASATSQKSPAIAPKSSLPDFGGRR